jgi:AAA domain/PLD-like domain
MRNRFNLFPRNLSMPQREKFALVQPVGTHPRPSAFRPKLQSDFSLPISPEDLPAKIFRVALAELIGEMKRRRGGYQSLPLEDGERTGTHAGGYTYQFEFGQDANIFEGAEVGLTVNGYDAAGNLTAILPGRILITLEEDFGQHIDSCVLKIDNTTLLQALHEQLQKVERGEVPGFRAEFAACVLKNAGGERPSVPLVKWPWSNQPNVNQRRFVEMALANEISWLFGPPGTGKTDTLSALTRLLFEAGKRILICSNTNQAVDQLLQKLCQRMHENRDPALTEGRVVRLGNIEDQLENEFGNFIKPERIAERKSEPLLQRKRELEFELERLRLMVAQAEEMLRLFARYDETKEAEKQIVRQMENADRAQELALSNLSQLQGKQAKLTAELQRWQQAGVFWRFFMRSEQSIQRDLLSIQSSIHAASTTVLAAKQEYASAEKDHKLMLDELEKAGKAVAGENREHNKKVVADYHAKSDPCREELAAISEQLEGIRRAVLCEARIVGATVTRTFMRPVEFAAFDTVIIDEASMILLPVVFQIAGLATESVVIAGDFQQLPPIMQTEQQCIHDILAHHIFFEAGIKLHTAVAGLVPRLVMLDEQFRMDHAICNVVSNTFYEGKLKTSPQRKSKDFTEPTPLTNRLTIIETSTIWPFTTRNAFKSRLNVMHALAVRNLVLHLQNNGRIIDGKNRGRVGICTPYAAQAKLLREMLRSHGLDGVTMRASTVHSFQGDERELMILDLVDSIGERGVGMFLQAENLDEIGAKLLNVALSRAKEGIIIVANLAFLDEKLPSNALLRAVLHEMQQAGQIINVREILALHPISEDLKHFRHQHDLDPESLRTGLFRGNDFWKLCYADIENAKKSVVIYSAFITPERVAPMGDLFHEKIASGVRIRCVTRPPDRNGTISVEQGRNALVALESIGVAIDLRDDIHEKAVIIDNAVVWFGSLNPLSHTSRTSELMARMDNTGFASQISNTLSIKRRSAEEMERGALSEPENPRCGMCNGWTVLVRDKQGLFFTCVKNCGWTQETNIFRRR